MLPTTQQPSTIGVSISENGLPLVWGVEIPPILLDTRQIPDDNGFSNVKEEIYSDGSRKQIISSGNGLVYDGANWTDRVIQANGTHFNVFSSYGSLSFDKSDCTIRFYDYGTNPTVNGFEVSDSLDEQGNPVFGNTFVEKMYWTIDNQGSLVDATQFGCNINTSQNATGKYLSATRSHASGSFLNTIISSPIGEPFEDFVTFFNNITAWNNNLISFAQVWQGMKGDSIILPDGTNIGDLPVGTYSMNRGQLIKSGVGESLLQASANGNPFHIDLEKAKQFVGRVDANVRTDGRVDLTFVFDNGVQPVPKGSSISIDPQYSYKSSSSDKDVIDTNNSGTCDDTNATYSINDDTLLRSIILASASTDDCYRSYTEFDTSTIPDYADITDVVFLPTVNTVLSTEIHDFYGITTTQPSTISTASTLFSLINNGNLYVNDLSISSTGLKTIDLGTLADSDLESQLQSGKNWFAIGSKLDDTVTQTASGKGMYFDSVSGTTPPKLLITYTLPQPTIATPTIVDNSATSVTVTANGTANGHGDSILGYYYEKYNGTQYVPEPVSITSSPQSYFKLDNIGSGKIDSSPLQGFTSFSTTPIAYYEFNDADISGATLDNVIGTATYDGTITGTLVSTTGLRDQAQTFDGTNDYVTVGDTTTFKSFHGNGGVFTITGWFKQASANTGVDMIMATTTTAPNNDGFHISLSDGTTSGMNRLGFGNQFTSTEIVPATSASWHDDVITDTDTNWHFFAFQWQDNVAYCTYFDNLTPKCGTPTDSPVTTNSANPLRIGSTAVGTPTFNGSLEDIAIYTSYLSKGQIQQLYNNGLSRDAVTSTDTVFPQLGKVAGTEHFLLPITQPSTPDAVLGDDSNLTIESFLQSDYTDQTAMDIDYVSTSTSDIRATYSSELLTATMTGATAGSTQSIYRTLVSSTEIQTIQFKADITSFASLTGTAGMITFGLSSGTGIYSASDDRIQFVVGDTGAGSKFYGMEVTDNASIDTTMTKTFSRVGQVETLYVTISHQDSFIQVCIDDSSDYGSPLECQTATVTGLKGMKYFWGTTYDSVTAGNITVTIDDIEYYSYWHNMNNKIGGALIFDDSTYYSTATEEESTYDFDRTDSFSISTWINVTPVTAFDVVLSKREVTSTDGYMIHFNGNEIPHFYFEGTGYLDCRATTGLTENTWQNLIVTYDGTGLCNGVTFYINGVVDATVTVNETLSAYTKHDGNLFIGALADGTLLFRGLLDELRFYNSELSQTEVTALASYSTISGTTLTDTGASNGDTYRAYALSEINISEPSSSVSCAVLSTDGDCATDSTPAPEGGGGGAGGGGAGGTNPVGAIDSLLGLNIIDEIHRAVLGQLLSDSIKVVWDSPNNLDVKAILVADSPFNIVFQKTPFTLLGDPSGSSEAEINYSIQIPSKFCSDGQTVGCVQALRYEVSVEIQAVHNGLPITKNTVITIDLSGKTDIPFTFVLLAIGSVPVAYFARKLGKGKHKRTAQSSHGKSRKNGSSRKSLEL